MSDFAAFLEDRLGRKPSDLTPFERAVTHASVGRDSYDRLEFLGDRVLGLVVARWLYERFPNEPEGQMSRRYNALVSRETCAEVGRALGVPAHIRLGKQAREDRASDSDNVVGDVVEALIGALLIDGGMAASEKFEAVVAVLAEAGMGHGALERREVRRLSPERLFQERRKIAHGR